MIFPKEIVGIYLGETKLNISCLRRKMGKWSLGQAPLALTEPSRSAADQMKSLLKTMQPSRRRLICIGIPRKALFLRELKFPGLEKDEALNAVRMGIELYSHLEPAEIFHDQTVHREGDEATVLLAYIPKSYISPVLRVIASTGHGKSLGPVSPATLGLDILLRRDREVRPPFTVLGRQSDNWILSLHGAEGWEGTHLVPVEKEETLSSALDRISQDLPSVFSKLAARPEYLVGNDSQPSLTHVPGNPCTQVRSVSRLCSENGRISWGLCSAGLGFSSYPAISLQEGARRRPLRSRIKPYQLIAGGTAAAMIFLTGRQIIEINNREKLISEHKLIIAQLQEQLAPLTAGQQQVEQVRKQLKDLQDFKAERPSELDILKALAKLTPAGTWIKSLNIKKNRLRLSAIGDSAVDAMERWRSSQTFHVVKLVSPVTKDRNQKEKFSVEIQLTATGGQKQ
ncbi:MAG TPA: hypothetical protein EYP57_01555 [Thermodesulfobacteriaceae bacterium]|nr:hypothetical protein [Thermodesulfobacteriaceae bacterium]